MNNAIPKLPTYSQAVDRAASKVTFAVDPTILSLVMRQAETIDRAHAEGCEARTELIRRLTEESSRGLDFTHLKQSASTLSGSNLPDRIARAAATVEFGHDALAGLFKHVFGITLRSVLNELADEVRS